MIQGTGSHVGKSVLVAGLCRALVRRGLRVAPFKPQNMSNNAAVTADGGEIGRAQALQARAARLRTSADMNPVLLKSETDTGAQVVVQGKRLGTMRAAEYGRRKAELMPRVLESFACVGFGMDVVLVEGAGSPAEINLRAGDIANMGFAEAADLPVILVGDIDRGGVIASLVGTYEVLPERDRSRIKGFLINKFRGDAGLLADGLAMVEKRTGWPCLGVIPWFEDTRMLPAEDVLGLDGGALALDHQTFNSFRSSPRKRGSRGDNHQRQRGPWIPAWRGNERSMGRPPQQHSRHDALGDALSATTQGQILIAVPALRRIANFDDVDPLHAEPGVSVVIVHPREPIPAGADLVLIPGSKSTIGDLAFVREQGWDIDIIAHYRRGGRVLGLCGGYQMLGRVIADPKGIEGLAGSVAGLGLLDVETIIGGDKATVSVDGRHVPSGELVSGYEIHLGRTQGPDCAQPFLVLDGRVEGARSRDGLVAGTYVHGIFAEDGFRQAFLRSIGGLASDTRYEERVEVVLDALADHLERHIAIDGLLEIAGLDGLPRAMLANRTAAP